MEVLGSNESNGFLGKRIVYHCKHGWRTRPVKDRYPIIARVVRGHEWFAHVIQGEVYRRSLLDYKTKESWDQVVDALLDKQVREYGLG